MAGEAPSRKRLGTPNWDVWIPALRGAPAGTASPEEYAFFKSSLAVAIGFSDLFWPPFIEHGGMVFRAASSDLSPEESANIVSWLKRFGGDRSETERMLNHVHLIDLFLQRNREPEPLQLAYLGRVLQETWDAKLAKDFPGKMFLVELEISQTNFFDWMITFCEVRSPAQAGVSE